MTLENGLILYHGSYTEVINIELTKCSKGKDFGIGFYLTSDFNQACNFIKTSIRKALTRGIIDEEQNYGFVTSFKFVGNPNDYNYYEFKEANQDWLNYIALNRRSCLAEFLKDKIDNKIFTAEIISGKIANDTTNPVITTYLNGLYGPVSEKRSADIAISLLLTEKLKDQYCFLTQKSIDSLKYIRTIRYGD
ncbi:MAG: DUF3990 domain-containing protein [Candidatus Riflebacteria bacterium]|nr:DUF3990 domain-containing protein [Candidatus Riflebacteria bacterium]